MGCVTVGGADHSDSDCIVVVILSHGSEGGVIYGRDKELPIEALVTPLKGRACQTLVGKPKLFFIQVLY
jgi:caspase 7